MEQRALRFLPFYLDTIAMQVDPTSPTNLHAYTILRIKRKRNEEPLDALGKPFRVIAIVGGMKETEQSLSPACVERNVGGWMSSSLQKR
jgi:hypothetical protein